MRRPLLSLAVAFGAGIAVQNLLALPRMVVLATAAALLVSASMAWIKRRMGIFRHTLWLGVFF
jgi:hypothetical protein